MGLKAKDFCSVCNSERNDVGAEICYAALDLALGSGAGLQVKPF